MILENAGCCASPVLSYDEALADPQVQARGLIEDGRVAPPVRFDPALRQTRPAFAERPGAHSRAVLEELLGLAGPELEALGESGAVTL